MNPIHRRSTGGRRLRLEQVEARRLLSVSPRAEPGLVGAPLTVLVDARTGGEGGVATGEAVPFRPAAIERATLLVGDSLVTSASTGNGWTRLFADSDLAPIDAAANDFAAFDSTSDGVGDSTTGRIDPPRLFLDGALTLGVALSPEVVSSFQVPSTQVPSTQILSTPVLSSQGIGDTLQQAIPDSATYFVTPTHQEDVQAPVQTVVPPPPVATRPTNTASVAQPGGVQPLETDRLPPVTEPASDPILESLATAIAREDLKAVATPEGDLSESVAFLPWDGESATQETDADLFDTPVELGPAPIASRPMERLASVESPPAGTDQLGAGMLDLTALLLESDEPQPMAQTDSLRPVEDEARDAALAVESWVRSLPAGGGLPVSMTPPRPGVQVRAPGAGLVPLALPTHPTESIESEKPTLRRVSAVETAVETAVDRVPAGTPRVGTPHYVAVLISTLLSGSVLWTSRRGDLQANPGCHERPRRERR